jgi:malate dehydrogenase (oxaloacetate-decarboxylating)
MSIPIFHDDQHGTAIVVLAGIINALKLTQRHKYNTRIVVNGAGAAGTAVTEFLLAYGFKDIIVCDKNGILRLKIRLVLINIKLALAKKLSS